MTITTVPSLRGRVHWVIAELDVRGEIDAHAAMCIGHAIEVARAGAIEKVLVDLRDLTAISKTGLALFRAHRNECRSHGIELGLLISGHHSYDEIVEAFVRVGLGDALQYADGARPPASEHPVRLLDRAQSVRRGRLARTARRFSPGRSRTA